MKAVFLDQQTFIPSISIVAIENEVEQLTCYPLTSANDVLSRSIDADIIITNKVVLNKELLQALPKLKLICVAATGTNNIDLVAAKTLGIKVMNVAGYSTASVSQYIFTQLLNFFAHIQENNNQVQQGKWAKHPTFCLHASNFDELCHKKIGLIGYGDIAKQVEKIATAFGMEVLIAERLNNTRTREGRMSFDEVLRQADVISIHCPQTPDTEKLFSYSAFEKMQSHALLINTARGPIIDNDALKHALQNTVIGGAILDVLETEPPSPEHTLLQSPIDNLIISGHIAWSSQQAQQKLINLIGDNIAQFKLSQ